MTGWSETDSARFIDYSSYFVPDRAAQIETIVSALPPLPRGAHIVELGCGQGLLVRALQQRFPDAVIHALDGSAEMLDQVRRLSGADQSRIEPERFGLEEHGWRTRAHPVHAVVSSLVIHHLDDAGKRQLFADIHAMLEHGGALVIADLVRPATEAGRRIAAAAWWRTVEAATRAAPDGAEIRRVFAGERWNMYDHLDEDAIDQPSTLADQLHWLEDAGFAAIEVHWMLAGHVIFSARKPARAASVDADAPVVSIRPLATPAEAEWCARVMASSEPWLTLGRTYEASRRVLRDPTREVYVAKDDGGLAGFLVLCVVGPFTGYIQTVCVAPERRGQGVGTRLLAFAEQRIFRDSPNAFLCVSSFNPDARRLYERLGYTFVGELTDYIVRGHSELLFRKSRGPWREFVPEIGVRVE